MKKTILIFILALTSFGAANAQCTAMFSATPNFLNNGDVAFNDSLMFGVSGAWTYNWTFGDGNTGWGNPVTHNYAVTGWYNACLTVTDTVSLATCTYCDSFHVYNGAPLCTAYFTHTDSGGVVNFMNGSSGSGLTYAWAFGDGGTSTATTWFTHTYAPGTYNCCLTVTNAGATCTDTYCTTIVIPTCGASFVAVADSTGMTYSFTSAVTGTGDTYLWTFYDSASTYTSNLPNPTYTFINTGYNQACLLVTSSTDTTCSASVCQNLYVSTPCDPYFYWGADSVGGTHFNNYATAGIPGMTYAWSFGDGGTSTAGYNPTHTYTSSGTYNVCLTVTNAGAGCTNSWCTTINIYIPSCNAGFTGVIGATAMDYNFTSVLTGTANMYSWTFGDGGTSTAANPSHTYTTNGYYNVCLHATSSTDTTCHANVCQTFNVSNGCNATFYINQDSANLYNYTIYSYGAGISGSTVTYLWDFGDSTTSTLQYPIKTYAWSGPFYICLTVTSTGIMGSCTDTHCDSIFPGHNPSNVVTVTVVSAATVAVHENTELTQSLANYPNPFSNITTINYSIKDNSPVDLYVMDILGNRIATIESGNKASGKHLVEFDATNLATGIYMLQLRTNTNTTTTKFIITR